MEAAWLAQGSLNISIGVVIRLPHYYYYFIEVVARGARPDFMNFGLLQDQASGSGLENHSRRRLHRQRSQFLLDSLTGLSGLLGALVQRRGRVWVLLGF